MKFLNTFEDHVAGISVPPAHHFPSRSSPSRRLTRWKIRTLVVNGVNTLTLYTILIANDDDPLMACTRSSRAK